MEFLFTIRWLIFCSFAVTTFCVCIFLLYLRIFFSLYGDCSADVVFMVEILSFISILWLFFLSSSSSSWVCFYHKSPETKSIKICVTVAQMAQSRLKMHKHFTWKKRERASIWRAFLLAEWHFDVIFLLAKFQRIMKWTEQMNSCNFHSWSLK